MKLFLSFFNLRFLNHIMVRYRSFICESPTVVFATSGSLKALLDQSSGNDGGTQEKVETEKKISLKEGACPTEIVGWWGPGRVS